jgi:hypothetical protein
MTDITRQVRRAQEREQVKLERAALTGHETKVGFGRLGTWLRRHPKLAPYHGMAVAILKTGERAQQPSWRAVRKMMVVLATAPRIKMVGVGVVPYLLHNGRHERGSWRSFPRQVIDANLQVQS